MSFGTITTTRISTGQQLCDALDIPFSGEQLAAITAPLEPSVIIAGAGSGKTTVMAARVVWLVGTGQVRPDEVLGLTFTRKAAAELANRIADALQRAEVTGPGDGDGAELVMTYDSFAARLVSEFGLRIGLDSEPTMITGASRFRLATRVVADASGPFHQLSRLSHHSIPERVLALDAELQSHLCTTEEVRLDCDRTEQRFAEAPLFRGNVMRDVRRALDTTAERRELLGLADDYQQLKQRLGVVEFADQLREAVKIATNVPEVGEELRRRFKVVLLDEYQDTSAAQAELLRALFTGHVGSPGMGFPVTAVGDPYQAIYGWRGAASGNILEFANQFRRSDASPAERLTLSVNRRSGQRILEVGNALAGSLSASPSEAGVSLVAPAGAPSGKLAAASFDTFREEVDWLAEAIVGQHAEGQSWADQAILVRRNALLAPIFEALREREVPVEIVGLGGLLGLPEIQPIVATLRVLDDVMANPEVVALLTGPRWSLGLGDLEALARRARELATIEKPIQSFDEALVAAVTQADPGESVCLLDAIADLGDAALSPEGKRRLGRFHAELSRLRRHIAEPVADLVTRVIAVLGLEAELLASNGSTSQVARFLTEVSGYVDVDGDSSLTGLLAYLDAEEDFGEGLMQAVPSAEDSVKLMTVHRAKGLEWETVYLPSLVDKVFPAESRTAIWPFRAAALPARLRGDAGSIPQLKDYDKDGLAKYRDEAKSEHELGEDRLAYVAATRAKTLVVASNHVWTPGNTRPRRPSRYFVTIRDAAAAIGTYLDVTTTGMDKNPVPAELVRAPWPTPFNEEQQTRRRAAAELVLEAASVPEQETDAWAWQSGTITADEAAQLAAWDASADHLIRLSTRRTDRDITLPTGLSASALLALGRDPAELAATLRRRMPRKPSAGARIGTQFHNWVQARFELPAALDETPPSGERDLGQLRRLIQAFERGQFADIAPTAVEVPFLMRRGSVVLRGRIDAVYAWAQNGYSHLVVDWKTSNLNADPLQLAVYRQAWAEANQLPVETVGAAFYHVLQDRLQFVEAPAKLIDEALARGIME